MKTLLAILLFVASSTALANTLPIQKISHTTIMTRDSMIVLDKRAGTFWKVKTGCELPIKMDSNVRFISNSRVIRKGTEVTFLIDTKENKHTCSVQKISKFS